MWVVVVNNDFSLAMNILHRVANPDVHFPCQGQFSAEHRGQGLITTALKIIHKAVKEGSNDQQKELSRFRHEIVVLNTLLANHQLTERVRLSLGIEVGDEVQKLEKIEIALPLTTFEKMIETACRIPRVVLSIITDIALLPAAGILLLIMLVKVSFDPAQPKKDAIPILLLHGSGFNESEWVLGRQFLKKEQYGSVFSLNYDGLVSNDPTKGIDDYAADKVRTKILRIQQFTGQNRVILIGHSMGGMIAGCYAERFAIQDGIQIEHVISIASPWQGSPIVDRFLTGEGTPKRYNHMSSTNQFRKDLVAEALHSERTGLRNYYSIGSETDFLVPGAISTLTEDPRRQRIFSYMGHYGIIASPRVWCQIRTWLDGIYAKESAAVRVSPILDACGSPQDAYS